MTSSIRTSANDLELVGSIDPTAAATRRWLVVSIAAFVAFCFGFGAVFERITGAGLEPIVITASSPRAVLAGTGLLVFLLVFVVVPHELLHGLCLVRYGGDPTYGVGLGAPAFLHPRAYASSEAVYTRNQLLVAALAPFVVITVAGVGALAVLESPLLIVPLAANAAGSVGDFRVAASLARYPADVRVTGLPDGSGLGVYGRPSSRSPAEVPFDDVLATVLVGAAGTLTLTVATLFAAVVTSIAAGSGTIVVGEPDGPWYRFLFRHDLIRGGTGAAVEFGVPAIGVLAFVGGLTWALAVAVVDRLIGSADEHASTEP
ncbi:DUF3267 domain-containing protein [Natrialbaceae archaeon AArc-T1-2]|uniref:DUF3267 domain-containing protein n=1 Tax=Natrialbaceae archaeon AArc-T1-2 TaxID=3053904 RepID=UPI00255B031C|nr:DUF3267 domain-containing protein [Natrialbaceae archaeon AArc-T1-2]WIV66859.1 DUF3267 domain-containing protein [Natrialbaceae archaeon AArc-T1-2]